MQYNQNLIILIAWKCLEFGEGGGLYVHGCNLFNKTKRRPQEDKQDKNKEEWKRKDYNHVHILIAVT